MGRVHDFQKYEEMTHGKYFIAWVNSTYKLDYRVYPGTVQDSHVDVYAESPNSLPKLSLQMVTSNGPTEKLMRETIRRLQKGLDIEVKEVKEIEWISSIIDNKTKKYPDAVKKDLILVIEGFMPTPSPDTIKERFRKYSKSSFKGIYYVSLPVRSYPETDDTKNGFIVPIKDSFY